MYQNVLILKHSPAFKEMLYNEEPVHFLKKFCDVRKLVKFLDGLTFTPDGMR